MTQAGEATTKIFVNLPVRDLDRSVDFFTRLGFEFDPQFTDEKAMCLIVNEHAYVMLLVQDFFTMFTRKDLCDASTGTETILALSADSREAVDSLVTTALEAGGSPANDPMDQGGMYGWSFQDPDGHLWEVMYTDPGALEQ